MGEALHPTTRHLMDELAELDEGAMSDGIPLYNMH